MFGKDGRFYDRSFDFNRDGKLDAYEYSVMDEVAFGNKYSGSLDEDDDEPEDELEMAGLNRYELDDMDEDERRETLEDAGLDPDDFDFE